MRVDQGAHAGERARVGVFFELGGEQQSSLIVLERREGGV